jgi:hypothetical protein
VCYTEDGLPPLVLSTAIDRLDSDTLVVASAGNHGDQSPTATDKNRGRKPGWPAALDGVVAVGAAHADGAAASFTPKDAPWIDCLAPGIRVTSTFLYDNVDVGGDPENPEFVKFEGFASWSGTSFAAANVSGAIAARTQPGRKSAREVFTEMMADARRDVSSSHPFLRCAASESVR